MTYGSASLGSVAEFINGAAFSPADWGDEGRPIIRIQNLTDPKKPFNRTRREVSPRLTVQPGDLLVSWSATLGVFTWESGEEGLLNQHIFRVLLRADLVDKSYLRHMLSGALDSMASHLHGATMQHVNRAAFLGTEIPLPPLPEQRRIASILDGVEQLRRLRRQSESDLDRVIRVAADDLLQNVPGQPEVTIGEIASVQTGPFGSLLHSQDYVSDGIPIVNPMHIGGGRIHADPSYSISRDKYQELRSYALAPGDVVLGRRGEMGRAAEVLESDGELLCGTGSLIVRPRTSAVTSTFLLHALTSPSTKAKLEQAAQGVTMLNLNQAIVSAVPIGVPTLEDQAQFGLTLQRARNLAAAQANHLAKLDELFASLQYRAFRGEL